MDNRAKKVEILEAKAGAQHHGPIEIVLVGIGTGFLVECASR